MTWSASSPRVLISSATRRSPAETTALRPASVRVTWCLRASEACAFRATYPDLSSRATMRLIVCSVTAEARASSRWDRGPPSSRNSTATEAWLRSQAARCAFQSRSVRRATADSSRPVGHCASRSICPSSRCGRLRARAGAGFVPGATVAHDTQHAEPIAGRAWRGPARCGDRRAARHLARPRRGRRRLDRATVGGPGKRRGVVPASGAESTRASELDKGFVTDPTLPALVVVEADGALAAEQLAAVQAFTDAVPGLVVGEGMTVGDLLTAQPVMVPSTDGAAVLVTVLLDAKAASEQVGDQQVVNQVVAALRTASQDLTDQNLTAWVTGPAGSIADLVEAFGGIDSLLLLVALAVVFVILVLVYRSPSLPFTVLFTALFGLAAAALVVYQLAKAGVLVLNGQSQGILFILVVGAATDYSLLVVARYREELRRVSSVYT